MKPQVNQKPYNPYIIFDIDGTLANIEHRLHHIKRQPPDWNSFNDAMVDDDFNQHIVAIFKKMCAAKSGDNHPSIFVTGRPETHREETQNWLMKYNIVPNYLFMRPANDYRSDVEIKKEIVEKYIMQAPILFIIDDRNYVVGMWRSLGYKCLQCQEGDY